MAAKVAVETFGIGANIMLIYCVKIAVNTRWLISGKQEGFGWYTYHVLKRLAANMPEVSFVFLTDRKLNEYLVESLNVTYNRVFPPARHPFLWYVWNEISVPWVLKKIQPDLYFSPDGFLPSKLNIPTLTTIHDLNFEDEPSYLDPKVQAYYKKHIRAAAEKANHILTVSEFSKVDISERYQIDAQKITALHNGPQKTFSDLRNMKIDTQQRHARTKPYFLFVGAQNPRKNLHRIFAAFEEFKKNSNLPQNLVLVGERMMWNDEIKAVWESMTFKENVIFTGRLTTNELNKLYSAATALIFPSLHEGFGMPIIEAFSAMCPVVTSKTTAMPEIAGDAALLVDPTNTTEIVNAMKKVASHPELRKELREKGKIRAQDFSWDAVADETEKIIRQLLHA